ncbi:MAG TPA: type II toxin-antitoxin system RelE/ParE family toxin [Burkholderiales bacterium]|nr:type II toxin-antitoxin system RelE/ParE family toxin [Burkholderiales bacterium]
MTSPAGRWRIDKIANQARRTIETLDPGTQDRILEKIESLETDPFSGDIKKIRAKRDIYRARLGAFRIYFRINPIKGEIDILLVDQRGSIKERTLGRI